MDYEAVRKALGLPEGAADWASIKSAGRQGVARAFQEGGRKKAEKKMAKMLMAAQAGRGTAAADAQAEKKRRRRFNERERAAANKQGQLTDVQFFQLFANQRDNWERVRGWLEWSRVRHVQLPKQVQRPRRVPSGPLRVRARLGR